MYGHNENVESICPVRLALFPEGKKGTYKMKRRNRKVRAWQVVTLCLLTLLLLALLALVAFLERGKTPEAPENAAVIPTQSVREIPEETQEATVPQEEPTELQKETTPADDPELIELETPFGPLYFPEMWADILKLEVAEEEQYRMEFGCSFDGETVHRVFDVSFGQGEGMEVGAVTTKDGQPVPVFIFFHEPDEVLTADQRDTFLAMQEDANRMIALLPAAETEAQMELAEDVLIRTPFCQLHYPGQWEEYLYVEHTGGRNYEVAFYAEFDGLEPIFLFAVQFGTAAEDPVLEMTDSEGNTVGVTIRMAEIDETDLTQDQLEIIYAMQDALNDLLQALAEETTGQAQD